MPEEVMAASKKKTVSASKPKPATKITAAKAPAAKAAAPKAAAKPAREVPGPQVGQKAPAVSLKDDSGKTVSLADFKGRKVVLYFYPKDSTAGCTQQACDFRDGYARLGKSKAAVLGVSADSVESHKKFKEKQGLNFPLLSDPEHKALDAYGVWQEKSLYGRKFMGIVRSTFIIDETGKIAKVYSKVKVAGHVDDVLASL
jgi:peroxiredoxin Q/BCP